MVKIRKRLMDLPGISCTLSEQGTEQPLNTLLLLVLEVEKEADECRVLRIMMG